MMIYTLWVCALLLVFFQQNVAKCSNSPDEGCSAREGSSTWKKKKRYVDYVNSRPHSRQMSAELETQLTEKEEVLRRIQVFKWDDIPKYPLVEHIKYWDNFCGKLWTGIPEFIPEEYIRDAQSLCVANDLFPMANVGIKGGTYFKAFPHNYDPELHPDVFPVFGDFICCECKNDLQILNFPHLRTYFFVMKIREREYFLLRKMDKAEKKKINQLRGAMLKIVDYVNLPESTDINLNI